MTLREQTEQRERETLSSRACLAEQTRGRARPEEPCGVRTCFQRGHGPHRLLQGLPAAEAQDPGVPPAGGGPLPYPDDPHPGGQPHCPDHRPGAGA